MSKSRARYAMILGLLIGIGTAGWYWHPAEAASSPTQGYAWGENLGWINMGAVNGNLQVGATQVTGFAWSRTYGWVNFGPFTNATGVTNTPGGVLGGYAWSALGWIRMTGVTIGPTGHFTGIANSGGTAAGRVAFSCAHCMAQTDWRPRENPAGPAPESPAPVAPGQGVVPTPATPPDNGPLISTGGPEAVARAGSLFDVIAEPLFGKPWLWWVWWLVFLVIITATWLLTVYWLHWRHRRRLQQQGAAA